MRTLFSAGTRWLRTVGVLGCVWLGMASAQADGLGAPARQQILSVVQAQLRAFARDDADRAFSYATPAIQRQLGSAQNFVAMVRRHYAVVYRPASTVFMQPQGEGSTAALQVRMTDGNGESWTATYVLQRQKGGQWRISGCRLEEAGGAMV